MRLRNLPCMGHLGQAIWPPVWRCIDGADGDPDNHTTVLEEVHPSNVENRLLLIVRDKDSRYYIGTVRFEDEKCRDKISHLLAQHYGEPIARIGELEADA